MFQRYFTEPYRFVPPYRRTLWLKLARYWLPRHVRRKLRITRWHFSGQEHLRQSCDSGAGILIASNHCRFADSVILGFLGQSVGRYFYQVMSHHLFKQSRVRGWMLRRLGGLGILREGVDREALRACARVLATAERPVVIYPEGTWFRQNDRLGPLQEGLTLMLRQAVKDTTRPVVVHPTAIKYWVLDDPEPEIRRRLERIEKRLGWLPRRNFDFIARIERIGNALLAVKEIEQFDQAQTGDLDTRIARLGDARVSGWEKMLLGRTHDGWILERVRRLRQHLVRRLLTVAGDRDEERRVRDILDDLLFCENLNANSLRYLTESPTTERLVETVQRLEETLADEDETPLAAIGAAVAVGPALDARTFALGRGESGTPLMPRLAADMQGLLDAHLVKGPPLGWGRPGKGGISLSLPALP